MGHSHSLAIVVFEPHRIVVTSLGLWGLFLESVHAKAYNVWARDGSLISGVEPLFGVARGTTLVIELCHLLVAARQQTLDTGIDRLMIVAWCGGFVVRVDYMLAVVSGRALIIEIDPMLIVAGGKMLSIPSD